MPAKVSVVLQEMGVVPPAQYLGNPGTDIAVENLAAQITDYFLCNSQS